MIIMMMMMIIIIIILPQRSPFSLPLRLSLAALAALSLASDVKPMEAAEFDYDDDYLLHKFQVDNKLRATCCCCSASCCCCSCRLIKDIKYLNHFAKIIHFNSLHCKQQARNSFEWPNETKIDHQVVVSSRRRRLGRPLW